MKSIRILFVIPFLFSAIYGSAIEPDDIRVYKTVEGTELTLHIFNPSDHREEDKRPAIVFFFGGGWEKGNPEHFYRQSEHLASRGMVAICADYRTASRHNTSPAECVEDGKSAMRWVRGHADELGIDPDQLAAGGGSAGGHIAAATALLDGFNKERDDNSVSCRPNALVLFNPVIDNGPDGYGYERVKDYWEAFSPLHNIREGAPPTLILLGTEDELIPVKTVKKFEKEMLSVGSRCEVVLYEGQEHGFFNEVKFERTLAEMDRFLVSLGYLKPTISSEDE